MREGFILFLIFVLLWFSVMGDVSAETMETSGITEYVDDLPFEKLINSSQFPLLHPNDFIYVGAFRLPDDGERPNTFAYGGEAMTYNPKGDPCGEQDGFPGSLFVMGHNRMPYGELSNGNRIAEITIPLPVISQTVETLNQAKFLQPFTDVGAAFFPTLNEIPRVGMQYLDTPQTGPRIHLCWGQHFQDDPEVIVPSHAWFDLDLSSPNPKGPWYIGHQSLYSVNDYLFEIPTDWVHHYLDGFPLATGRFRDGGWSGMGPSLFAYCPWVDETGLPEEPQKRLEEKVLLLYESSLNTPDIVRCMRGYQHGDEWSGGAWITTSTGKTAVIFVGTKSTGDRYWYGFLHPDDPEYACVEEEFIGQFTLCRMADGSPCPDERLAVCSNHTSNRGWWSTRFNAQFIFYDPFDLAKVVEGQLASWEPQPYTFMNVDDCLFLNPMNIELEMLGTGAQRRYRLGDVAYDRENGLLYVLELFADETQPVVHVWQVQ